MSNHNPTWGSLHNKLCHAKKNFSAIEREINILAQSYHHLAGSHRKLQASYNRVLAGSKAKDKALESRAEENYMLRQENDALKDSLLELNSLVTPFSCDGTSAEDYLTSRE